MGIFRNHRLLTLFLVLIPIYGDVVSQITPEDPTLEFGYSGSWISFVLPMVLFLVFAIPFLFVNEKHKKSKMPSIGKLLKGTFKQLGSTFRDIRRHKNIFIFTIGYFFIADIANVIVLYMMPMVTDGLIIGDNGKPSDYFGIVFIIIATLSAVGFTYFIGKFGEKFGGKKTFYFVGLLWGIALIIGIILIFSQPYINIGFNIPFIFAIIMGLVAGPALGGTWTAQRIMITELAPKEKFGEYFGFSKLSGKLSSAIGPIVFGSILTTADIIGKYAYGFALIGVGFIMLFGLLILIFIKKE